MPGTRPIEILLVEDNPADAHLVKEALAQGDLDHRLHVTQDGEVALAFLRQESGHEDAPRPDLILLDLNLPRVSGHEVLERVKADPGLAEIPVVVLSTSDDPDDIRTCYANQASAFVTKPVEYQCFLDRVLKIGEYWSYVAHTPDHRAASG